MLECVIYSRDDRENPKENAGSVFRNLAAVAHRCFARKLVSVRLSEESPKMRHMNYHRHGSSSEPFRSVDKIRAALALLRVHRPNN